MTRGGRPEAGAGRSMTRGGRPTARDGDSKTRLVPGTGNQDRPVTWAPENGDAR
jgi:hypothetical protein